MYYKQAWRNHFQLLLLRLLRGQEGKSTMSIKSMEFANLLLLMFHPTFGNVGFFQSKKYYFVVLLKLFHSFQLMIYIVLHYFTWNPNEMLLFQCQRLLRQYLHIFRILITLNFNISKTSRFNYFVKCRCMGYIRNFIENYQFQFKISRFSFGVSPHLS